ncbi:LuxR C-terminal-related transcriptional regulator [Bradyrhizobium sp. BR 10289]|uniref:LuxR C-terminal-related transcriptional regulator n=1 Tax=Bradyrhizobium sp. BR 10289 TaxID=2749993 RepID=UPI001C646CC5|nr:LuxR C-terminal-related transcriptional regulator [Bradyrhizobium sp. BR 10289]MBW7968156.1 helix-turn-helix domain-containing protein [Bradyrhizobium sp. BR 10289]
MTEKLPGVLAEIAEVAGETAALMISARRGGQRVYFPSTKFLHKAQWLVECVGHDLAAKICAHFEVDGRGQRIDIPLHVGGTYRQFVRSVAERVHKLDRDGKSSTEIAQQLGLTQRTVHRHRARHQQRKNDKQGKLF